MAAPYHAIMTLDLTDDETAALARLLRRTIDDDRYPLSPRLAPLTLPGFCAARSMMTAIRSRRGWHP